FLLSRLRWDDTVLAPEIRGDVRLNRRELRFLDLSAAVGEGLLRGQVGVNLQDIDRSWFNLGIDRVELARLLVAWPGVAGGVEGPADVRLRGTVGREWSGTGDVYLPRGRVLGAEVTEWRLPLTFSFAPGRGRGEVQVYETTAQVGRGRATGRATFGWGTGTH